MRDHTPVTMRDHISESSIRNGRPERSRWPLNRRISCKDLGQGDCKGWLCRRKEPRGRILQKNWSKYYFVLTKQNLYYYKSDEDVRAQGVIHLPGFTVSPAPEVKKKFAFKACHAGTTFYFASDRQDDMAKWMNKMMLAAIQYIQTTPAIPPTTITEENDQDDRQFSESEDESEQDSASCRPEVHTRPACTKDPRIPDLQVHTDSPNRVKGPSKQAAEEISSDGDIDSNETNISEDKNQRHEEEEQSKPATLRRKVKDSNLSLDDFRKTWFSIQKAALSFDGADIGQRRISTLSKTGHLQRVQQTGSGDKSDEHDATHQLDSVRKLSSLQRTLKAKQLDIEVIEKFLSMSEITSKDLKEFKQNYPYLCSYSERYIETDI